MLKAFTIHNVFGDSKYLLSIFPDGFIEFGDIVFKSLVFLTE